MRSIEGYFRNAAQQDAVAAALRARYDFQKNREGLPRHDIALNAVVRTLCGGPPDIDEGDDALSETLLFLPADEVQAVGLLVVAMAQGHDAVDGWLREHGART